MDNDSLKSKMDNLEPERLKKVTERSEVLKRDIFQMIMRSEGCTFAEAVEILSENVNEERVHILAFDEGHTRLKDDE